MIISLRSISTLRFSHGKLAAPVSQSQGFTERQIAGHLGSFMLLGMTRLSGQKYPQSIIALMQFVFVN